MANDNETAEQVLERMTSGMGRDCSVECQLLESDVVEYADRILAAHNREIDELKTQIKIAKDAFFNISMCDHSQKIHDIFCEAEFMMNHSEARRIGNGNE